MYPPTSHKYGQGYCTGLRKVGSCGLLGLKLTVYLVIQGGLPVCQRSSKYLRSLAVSMHCQKPSCL